MIHGIDTRSWHEATGLKADDEDGPHLLLPELAGLLMGKATWIPFAASRQLYDERYLGTGFDNSIVGNAVKATDRIDPPLRGSIEAVYFGVPTIIHNGALFGARDWSTPIARVAARDITAMAITAGAKLIVSGLGSGDISAAQRIEDMGGGEIVTFKHFGIFKDWIIARWL